MQVVHVKNLRSVREELYTKSFTSELPVPFEELQEIFGPKLREVIQEIGSKENKSSALAYLYSKSKRPEFLTLYNKILFSLRTLLEVDFIYQPNPTFRIQWPGQRAGFFHIDSWVGHGPSTINIWIPLTDLTNTSTVWMANREDTHELKNLIIDNKLNVSEYEKIIEDKMYPQVIPLGNFMTFNDNILHGSVINNDSMPRISFDFRIAMSPFLIGAKKIGIDYISDLFKGEIENGSIQRVLARKCRTIVFSGGKLAHLSHVTQRAIIGDFCNQRNFVPEIEGSEFYTMNHFPQIKEWIAIEQDKKLGDRLPIVIASRSCFESDADIIQLCSQNGLELYDALDNLQLC